MSQSVRVVAREAAGQSLIDRWSSAWQRYSPGLLLVLSLAVPARLLGQSTSLVSDVVLALIAGIVVNNLWLRGSDNTYRTGIRFSQKTVLQIAIILLGGGLSFAAVLQIGAQALGLIVFSFILSFSLGMLFARVFSLPSRVGTLLGSGTAICGATAIITIGPLIAATEAEIAYAVTTIFSFNVLAVLIYPVLGHLFNLSDLGFGTWAGISVNDTSAVIATSYVFSGGAGAVATVVKLARTMLLVPLAVGIGSAGALRGRQSRTSLMKIMPWFIFGFAGMAALNSVGLVPTDVAKSLTEIAKFLIVIVLAAVGLNVDISKMRMMGPKPFAVGMLLATLMSGFGLAGAYVLGLV